MKHTTTINGIVSYELEPTDDIDRHLIEIMKGRSKVSMRQSSRGGLIFEMAKPEGMAVTDEKTEVELPVDLSSVQRNKS